MMQQKTYLPEDAGDGRHGSHLRKKKQLTQPSHWGRLLGACVPSRAFSFVLLSIITKTGGNWLNFCLFLHGGKLNCSAVLRFFPEAMSRCWPCGFFFSFFWITVYYGQHIPQKAGAQSTNVKIEGKTQISFVETLAQAVEDVCSPASSLHNTWTQLKI